jgi:hypothetical protein
MHCVIGSAVQKGRVVNLKTKARDDDLTALYWSKDEQLAATIVPPPVV